VWLQNGRGSGNIGNVSNASGLLLIEGCTTDGCWSFVIRFLSSDRNANPAVAIASILFDRSIKFLFKFIAQCRSCIWQMMHGYFALVVAKYRLGICDQNTPSEQFGYLFVYNSEVFFLHHICQPL
jgi:hypothetical protein